MRCVPRGRGGAPGGSFLGAVTAPFHRAPATGSGARRVDVEQTAVVGVADPDPVGERRRVEIDRVASESSSSCGTSEGSAAALLMTPRTQMGSRSPPALRRAEPLMACRRSRTAAMSASSTSGGSVSMMMPQKADCIGRLMEDLPARRLTVTTGVSQVEAHPPGLEASPHRWVEVLTPFHPYRPLVVTRPRERLRRPRSPPAPRGPRAH